MWQNFLKLPAMCDCDNIEIGSYSNQVRMIAWWSGNVICVDKCMQNEINFLWHNKIQTTGCCCGHNKEKPMINVIKADHSKMIALGYVYWINKHGVICYAPTYLDYNF